MYQSLYRKYRPSNFDEVVGQEVPVKILKNAIKNTEKAIISGDKEKACTCLKNAIKSLDNAKVKGLVHENKVSREKSRLTKKVNNMEVK